MSLPTQIQNTLEDIEEMKTYPGKKLCSCGRCYHPVKYDKCWKCFSEQPARVKQYDKNKDGYASMKDATESTDSNF
jgi:uncharacterized OB-fold protein